MNRTQDAPAIHKFIHPPVVALAFLLAALLLERLLAFPFEIPVWARQVGFGLALAGFFFGAAAFVEFRRSHTTLDPHGSVKALVSGGIYCLSRNPIYLGFVFLIVGFPLMRGTLWGLVAAPFFMLTLSRLVIEKEEAYLEKKFKEQYADYKSKVRRWL